MRKFEKGFALIAFLIVIYSVFRGFEINLYVLLRVVLIFLSIFYLWFGFFIFNRIGLTDLLKKEVVKKINAFKVFASITMGLVYSFSVLTIMYNIYLYSGKNFLLGVAIISLLVSTGLIALYNTLNMPLQRFYNQFYRRSLIIGAFMLLLWFTPIEARLDNFYKNYPEFTDAYKNYKENPNDPIAEERLRKTRNVFK